MSKDNDRLDEIITHMKFPDNGPEQAEVSRWVEENAGKLGLYDGATEDDIETSTKATWRWKWATLNNSELGAVIPGKYIVKLADGVFVALDEHDFMAHKQAINQHALETALRLIGEDEDHPAGSGRVRIVQGMAINDLKAGLRKAFEEEYK